MTKTTKKTIMRVVLGFAAAYGVIGLAYAFPPMFAVVYPLVEAMAIHFLLMPFAVIAALAFVMVPIFVLVLALFFLDMLMHKMAGLPFME